MFIFNFVVQFLNKRHFRSIKSVTLPLFKCTKYFRDDLTLETTIFFLIDVNDVSPAFTQIFKHTKYSWHFSKLAINQLTKFNYHSSSPENWKLHLEVRSFHLVYKFHA
jgi:hypothetical protein